MELPGLPCRSSPRLAANHSHHDAVATNSDSHRAGRSSRQHGPSPVHLGRLVDAPFRVRDKVLALEQYPVRAENRRPGSPTRRHMVPLPVSVVGTDAVAVRRIATGDSPDFIPSDVHEAIIADTVAKLAHVFQHRLQEHVIAATVRFFATEFVDEVMTSRPATLLHTTEGAASARGLSSSANFIRGSAAGGALSTSSSVMLPMTAKAHSVPPIPHPPSSSTGGALLHRHTASPPTSTTTMWRTVNGRRVLVPIMPNATSASPSEWEVPATYRVHHLERHPAVVEQWAQRHHLPPSSLISRGGGEVDSTADPIPQIRPELNTTQAEEALYEILGSDWTAMTSGGAQDVEGALPLSACQLSNARNIQHGPAVNKETSFLACDTTAAGSSSAKLLTPNPVTSQQQRPSPSRSPLASKYSPNPPSSSASASKSAGAALEHVVFDSTLQKWVTQRAEPSSGAKHTRNAETVTRSLATVDVALAHNNGLDADTAVATTTPPPLPSVLVPQVVGDGVPLQISLTLPLQQQQQKSPRHLDSFGSLGDPLASPLSPGIVVKGVDAPSSSASTQNHAFGALGLLASKFSRSARAEFSSRSVTPSIKQQGSPTGDGATGGSASPRTAASQGAVSFAAVQDESLVAVGSGAAEGGGGGGGSAASPIDEVAQADDSFAGGSGTEQTAAKRWGGGRAAVRKAAQAALAAKSLELSRHSARDTSTSSRSSPSRRESSVSPSTATQRADSVKQLVRASMSASWIPPLGDGSVRGISLDQPTLEAQLERDLIKREYDAVVAPVKAVKASLEESAVALHKSVEAKLALRDDLVKKYDALQQVKQSQQTLLSDMKCMHQVLVGMKSGAEAMPFSLLLSALQKLNEDSDSQAPPLSVMHLSQSSGGTAGAGVDRSPSKSMGGKSVSRSQQRTTGAVSRSGSVASGASVSNVSPRRGPASGDESEGDESDTDTQQMIDSPQSDKKRKQRLGASKAAASRKGHGKKVERKDGGSTGHKLATRTSFASRAETVKTVESSGKASGGSSSSHATTAELLKQAAHGKLQASGVAGGAAGSKSGVSLRTVTTTVSEARRLINRAAAKSSQLPVDPCFYLREEQDLEKMCSQAKLTLDEVRDRFDDAQQALIQKGKQVLLEQYTSRKNSGQVDGPMPTPTEKESLTAAILQELQAEFRDINLRREQQRAFAEAQERELDDIRQDMKRLTSGSDSQRDDAAAMMGDWIARRESITGEPISARLNFAGATGDSDSGDAGSQPHDNDEHDDSSVVQRRASKPATFVVKLSVGVQVDASTVPEGTVTAAVSSEQATQMDDLYKLEQALHGHVRRLMVAVSNVVTFHESMEVELTCKRCLTVFNGARILWPCGHVFCHNCLAVLYEGSPDSIACPECRTLVDIGFSPNTVLDNLVSCTAQRGVYSQSFKLHAAAQCADYHDSVKQALTQRQTGKAASGENGTASSNAPRSGHALREALMALMEDIAAQQQQEGGTP